MASSRSKMHVVNTLPVLLMLVSIKSIVTEKNIAGQQLTSSKSAERKLYSLIPTVLVRKFDKMLETGSIDLDYLEYLSRRKEDLEPVAIFFLADFLNQGLHNIPNEELPKLMNIITNLLPSSKFDTVFRQLASRLKYFQNDDLIIDSWNPFDNGVTGVALYKSKLEKKFYTKPIHKEESSGNIDMEDLEMAGYIPYKTLNQLAESNLVEDKNITVTMMLILNGEKFKDFWNIQGDAKYILGVNIPYICKYNKVPLLKAFFKSENEIIGQEWTDFGSEYIDPRRYVKQLCFLSQMLFFSRLNGTEPRYFESVKNDYCNNTYSGVIAPVARRGTGWPGEFCMTEYLMIPRIQCKDNLAEKANFCYSGHPVNNETIRNYEMMLLCVNINDHSNYCNNTLYHIIQSNFTYLDTIIMFYILETLDESPMDPFRTKSNRKEVILSEIIDKSIPSLQKQRDAPHMTYMIVLLELLTFYFEFTAAALYMFPHFTCQKLYILPSSAFGGLGRPEYSTIGMILYKNDRSSVGYDVKPLLYKNATLDYSSDSDVEVIVFLSDDNMFSEKSYTLCNVYILHDNLTEYSNHTCRSKIVGLKCNRELNFTIYLKAAGNSDVDDSLSVNGYSNVVRSEMWFRIKMLYISETIGDNSDSKLMFSVFKQDVEIADLKTISISNRNNASSGDVLTHFDVAVNSIEY